MLNFSTIKRIEEKKNGINTIRKLYRLKAPENFYNL